MDTSKYPADARKHLKRFQRSPGYQLMKKEHLAERERLQAQVRDRDAVIARLKDKLLEAGLTVAEIAKLAA